MFTFFFLQYLSKGCGTVNYMAPEILKGWADPAPLHYNEKCDIWSFGAMVVELSYEFINIKIQSYDIQWKIDKESVHLQCRKKKAIAIFDDSKSLETRSHLHFFDDMLIVEFNYIFK